MLCWKSCLGVEGDVSEALNNHANAVVKISSPERYTSSRGLLASPFEYLFYIVAVEKTELL